METLWCYGINYHFALPCMLDGYSCGVVVGPLTQMVSGSPFGCEMKLTLSIDISLGAT